MQLQTETYSTHISVAMILVPFVRLQIPYGILYGSWKIVTQSIAFEKAPIRVFLFSYEISEVMPKYADFRFVFGLFKTKANEKAFDNSLQYIQNKPFAEKNRFER